MNRVVYREMEGVSGFWIALVGAVLVAALGLASAWTMEHRGHIVTGMDNQIVWGTPHVFAVFLIVAASGALNVASVGSVFARPSYKPMARLSGLLAIALLVGGLAVLVLDLGRPLRLIVAMTTYNFKSIFAWNIFLYTGFLVVVVAYLFVMMGGLERLAKPVGLIAFIWRLALTTGTGSIFGWLVAREAYDAAVMAPLFVAMSLAFGTAIFMLLCALLFAITGRDLDTALLARLGRLMGIFVAAVLYFTAVQHLTNLYAAQHWGVERFLLWSGGPFPQLFWVVQVGLGSLAPLALVFLPMTQASRSAPVLAAVLVVIGGLAQLFVIIIGGQSYPLTLFPGMEESSSFFDGAIAAYRPSLPEVGLGLGGVALAVAITLIGVKVLRILPLSLTGGETEAAPRAV